MKANTDEENFSTEPLKEAPHVFLERLCTETLGEEGAFVIFRRPFCEEIEGFFSKKKDYICSPLTDLHKHKQGFLLQPFSGSKVSSYLLKPSLQLRLQKKRYSYSCSRGTKRKWQIYLSSKAKSKIQIPNSLYGSLSAAPLLQKEYISIVEKALSAITEKRLRKVVLSRYQRVAYSHTQKLFTTFFRLCELYPSTFVYFFCGPAGVWIGASPELLASCNGTNFESVALAATQAMPSSGSLLDVKWSKKEQEEQKFVKEYIATQLKLSGLLKIKKSRTESTRAGEMLHLRTLFSGKVPHLNGASTPSEQMIGRILQHLHPTPALCGYPTAEALSFIESEENIPRDLYGGFLGPMYSPNRYEFYVNIRCARFYPNEAILYAGAGIVDGSDPYKEWIETEIKCMTMQKVICS